jgi:hypothetical protein
VHAFLLRRALGETVSRETGQLHWAPCPDFSASLLALTRAGEGRYYFWDGVGGIGGWSGDSNIGSMLSRGRKSKRIAEYLAEFDTSEKRFPNHAIKLETISNLLAACISQAKHAYPDRFPDCFFDLKTLVKRSIDDAYRELTVPWADDEAFVEQLDTLIESADAADRTELRDDLAAAKAELADYAEGRKQHFNPTPHGAASGFEKAKALIGGRNRRLLKKTGRNPARKYWDYAGTTFVDMALFGSGTIRGVPGALPTILEEFAAKEVTFPAQYKALGILDRPLEILDY